MLAITKSLKCMATPESMELHPLEIELRHRILQDCYSTAYPWKPEKWAAYLQSGPLKFKKEGRLSFYIHINLGTECLLRQVAVDALGVL